MPSGSDRCFAEKDITTAISSIVTLRRSDGLVAIAERLPEYLRLAVRQPYWLERCQDQSYRHVNGFDKIILIALPDDVRLRLHLWHDDRIGVTDDIHNHRWDFASFTLAGKLRFEFFRPAKAGDTFHAYVYRWTTRGARFTLEPKGRRTLCRGFQCVAGVGSHYFLDRTLLHRTRKEGSGPTATLLVQGPAQTPTTQVFAARPKAEGALSQETDRMSISELRDRLERMASLLEEERLGRGNI